MSPDYEASLKKEGGIPDGPVLESLLAGETLDKKVETKEEEPMSECQVSLCSFQSVLFLFFSSTCFQLFIWYSVCPTLWECVSLSASAFVPLRFGGATGSCSSDDFLLVQHVCRIVIVWLSHNSQLCVLLGFHSTFQLPTVSIQF